MKILFFHPLTGYLYRGIERTVTSLATHLVEQGHDVTILTLRHPQQALIAELGPGVRVVQVPRSRYFSYAGGVPFFTGHLLRHRYDAVITYFGGFGVGPSLALSRRFRHMRIFLCPCYPVDLAPHRYAEFERWGLPERADGIWAASDHVAEQASRRFGRPVVPVPSAVDTTRFKPSAEGRAAVRSALGIGDSAPVLLTPAALVERKGIQHVIRALPALQRLYPDVTYLVAGEGPFRGEIEGMIRDLSLDTSVRLLGSVDAVEDLYAASDVVCLLAHGEANPMVIYEALASEVPLVTTDLPPFPDYLTSDVAVLLSSTAPEAVANALHEVLQDGPRRTRMGESGRRLAEERYSYTHVARLVSSLISSPGPDTLEHPAGAEHVQ